MKDRGRIDHEQRVASRLYSDFHYRIGGMLVGEHPKAEDAAWPFAMIDIDTLEYCRYCNAPIALFEIKMANERTKTWTKTWKLGKSSGLPAHLVVVHSDDMKTIDGFQVYHGNNRGPVWKPVPGLIEPHEFAVWLMNLHRPHTDRCPSMRTTIGFVDKVRSSFGKAV